MDSMKTVLNCWPQGRSSCLRWAFDWGQILDYTAYQRTAFAKSSARIFIVRLSVPRWQFLRVLMNYRQLITDERCWTKQKSPCIRCRSNATQALIIYTWTMAWPLCWPVVAGLFWISALKTWGLTIHQSQKHQCWKLCKRPRTSSLGAIFVLV